MRRSLTLVAVLVIALLLVPAAFAAGHGKGKAHAKTAKSKAAKAKAKGKNKFQLNGIVQPAPVPTADPGDGTDPSGDATTTEGTDTPTVLYVLVKSGTKTVKPFGQVLQVQIADGARFVDATVDQADGTEGADVPLTLADIVAGARVHLGGVIDRSDPLHPVFIARKVILQRLPEVAPDPEPAPTDTPAPEPSPTQGA